MATNFWKGGPGLSSSPAAGSLGRRSRSRSSGRADAYKIPDRWILWVPFQDRGGRSEQEELARGTSKRNWYRPKIRPLRRISKRERWHGLCHPPPGVRDFRIAGKSDFADLRFPAGGPFPSPSPRKTPPRPIAAAFGFPWGGTGRRAGRAGCARRLRCGTGQRLDREAGGDPADGCPSESAGRFFPCWTRKEAALKGEGWTVPFASPGAALRCPVVFLQAPSRPVRRACLFDLHPWRISGRRRPYGAHRPFDPPVGRGVASGSGAGRRAKAQIRTRTSPVKSRIRERV